MCSVILFGARIGICLLVLTLSLSCVLRKEQRYSDFTTHTPLKAGDCLVIGFLGGREPWNNEKRNVRRLALKLRSMQLSGVHVETVENTKRHLAVKLIKGALDRNSDGSLDAQEKASARLIIYGQSFGGAAVVKLARDLKSLDIPVALTVQIDSVGRNDAVIPSNVAAAANLYQSNGWVIKGESEIHSEDRHETRIIGNFKYDYSRKKIDLSQVSWLKKLFRAAHTKMDFDPEVWSRVEQLILAEIRRRDE
jgi:hypothetical protein